jgi:formylglycine-generating enzyme required for sulfatase activity
MGRILQSIGFIVCFLSLDAQIKVKEIHESLVKIKDRLYASKYEVSNKMYAELIKSLNEKKEEKSLQIAQIDSMRWLDKKSYNEPYVKYYHTHPAYFNYPVVNISYEGAKLFCIWLTEIYNLNPKRKFKKVAFKLPTEEEWIYAAQGGDTNAIYPWKENTLRNKKGQILFNYKKELSDTMWIDGKYVENTDVTAPVKSYWKNNYGIYNMGGNVSEMIIEKGFTKGGSWREDAEFMKVKNKNKFDGNAQSNIGFRYFMEIIEK